MQKENKKKQQGLVPGLFLVTLLYFSLGFVSILFGLLAFFCMAIPFVLLARYKKKVWCSTYCPRASLLLKTGTKQKTRPIPRQFSNGTLKKVMLWYFGLNLLFITGSTNQVAMGNMASMEYVRLFIAIPLVPLPQLITVEAPSAIMHLSYRLYSMMLSSTILGIVLSRLYRPRIWCAICPVGTLSNEILRKRR
ncbi:MAG TPA: 4Fe-4S binding protein [Sphaerochaeta sp.]|nr:4Fe-4S binding protein [Sphaerochaeta sp.]